jgi:hypothetical protein
MKSPFIGVWTPRLRAASGHMRTAARRVKVWTHERSTRPAHRSEPANPIYLLAAITLGTPALLTVPLIGMNPSIQKGAFANIITFLVVSAFVVAAVFQIKKLVDQPR